MCCNAAAMRVFLASCFMFLAAAGLAPAQDAVSDLTVTLPSGKTVHFQSEDQKEKFEAARAIQTAKVQQAQAKDAEDHPPKPFELGHTALDEKPQMNGKVNPNAPTFTAEYYMIAPESWAGKQVTLSVAYLRPYTGAGRSDGNQFLLAETYNQMNGEYYNGRFGGSILVMAKPEVASRLMVQCGTRHQYVYDRLKTTLIRGELKKLDSPSPVGTSVGQYGFFVDK